MHTSHYCNNRSKQTRESKPISNNKKRQVHDREKEERERENEEIVV